jgi:POT family proton-dependent oligopeptide transporter
MRPSLRPSSDSRRWSLSLVLLCAVQSCERFAFLAMVPLFVLYANERHGMPAPTALLVLAIFQALSYLGGVPAGWLADHKLGVRGATLLGAVLLGCGYGGLALDQSALLWPVLGMMVAGHSFFKTGLHALIGSVHTSDERARERAFLWNYLAANLGYIARALFGEWAHARHGWSTLFGGAAAAVAVGVALLLAAMPRLRVRATNGHSSPTQAAPAHAGSIRAVWLLCSVAVVFWLTSQQAGSSLTVFAAMRTKLQVTALGRSFQLGPGHFASLHGLMVLALLLTFLALPGRQHRPTSTAGKMLWGYVATAGAFALMTAAGLRGGDSGRVSGAWLVGCFALLSLAELLLAPLGVSLITQLAPKGKTAQAVGLWFAGSAVGNGLAGALGLCWDHWPHHRYFALLALLSLGAAAVLLPRCRQLD